MKLSLPILRLRSPHELKEDELLKERKLVVKSTIGGSNVFLVKPGLDYSYFLYENEERSQNVRGPNLGEHNDLIKSKL